MSKPKREYTTEFKQKAVELSYARGNAAEVCRELGLNPSVLGRWGGLTTESSARIGDTLL